MPTRRDYQRYARKGTTAQRGYSHAHQAERARWAPVVDAGHASCAEVICLMPSRWIAPGTPWDLAHTEDRTAYLGPAHQLCNRSEGSRRGNRKRSAIPPAPWRTSRRW